MGEHCYISTEETQWHWKNGLPSYYTYGSKGIGRLTVVESGGTPWVYATDGTPIDIEAEIRSDGFILREKETGKTVTRSGDWLVLKHADNEDDTVLQWQKTKEGMGYWAKFKSGGDWLCTDHNGELNVKNQGPYAVMWHNDFFLIND